MGNAIRLVLPYKSRSGPTIDKNDYEAAVSSSDLTQCPTFNFLKDQGEEITIPLPAPGQNGLTEVFVDFQWPEGAGPINYKQLNMQDVMRTLDVRKSEAAKSAEERMGRLRQLFDAGQPLPKVPFHEGVFSQFKAKLPVAKQNAKTLTVFEKRIVHPGCPVPDAASPGTRTAASVAQVTTKLPRLPTHSTKELWDRAMRKDFCDAYRKSGKKLDGEPADLGPKLDKVCSDKRLNP